jgi:type IV pilus assembly protein PilE
MTAVDRRERHIVKLQRKRGFTLIELLVAVTVISILTAVAIPSYSTYIRKSRRPDAKTALLDLAAREERYYTVNNSYTTTAASLGYATLPLNLGTGSTPDYSLTVAASATTATTFSLIAVPLNDQLSDTCGSYTLDNFGTQLNIYPSTGTTATTIPGCW